jgi:CelD/BcsL family acetyltransferase involved in cellulose biosynthesis
MRTEMSKMPSAVLAACPRHVVEPAKRPGACIEALSVARPGLRLTIHDDLAAVESIWRQLEPKAEGTIFQNFDYLAAWQRHVGTHENATPAIVSIHDASGLLAILPLSTSGRALRRLSWLAQDLCDYPGPLLSRDFARRVPASHFGALWREILALLQSDRRLRNDLIDLRKMPATIGTQANPFATLPVSLHPSEAYLTALQPNWDAFYDARRSAKARRQDRSKLKRLGELGTVRMVTPEQGKEVTRLLDILFAQKSETFARKGIADVFQRPGYREFFLDLISNPHTKDFSHVSELRVGAVSAAVNFGLEYRGRYSLYLVSYDEGLARFSPGAIHLNELMRWAIDRGLNEFDFLIGFQRLKREWSDQRIPLYDHIRGVTLLGHATALSLRALSRAKRAIKASPVLWDAYLSLRALLGALKPGHRRAA